MRLALVLAVLALPLAQACTTTTPSPATLEWVAWDGRDRLGFGFAGQWYVANATTGEVGPPSGWAPPTMAEPRPAPSRSAPDGSLVLAERIEAAGMGWGPGCSWGPYTTTVGFDLRRADGAVLRSWGEGASWKGTAWGDSSHGYVWEDAGSTLSVVDWGTGSVASSVVTVPPHYPFYPANPPDLLGRQLVLPGPGNVMLLDPVGPSIRTSESPVLDGTPAVRGATAYFSRWNGGTQDQPDQSLEAALVDLDSGAILWRVTTPGTWAQWSTRGLVVADGDRVLLWRDGQELAPLEMEGAGTVLLIGRGDFIAVALRDADPRLVVFGPDMARVLDVDGDSFGAQTHSGSATSTGTPWIAGQPWTGVDGPSTDGSASRPVSALAAATLALATLAAAFRRRLT